VTPSSPPNSSYIANNNGDVTAAITGHHDNGYHCPANSPYVMQQQDSGSKNNNNQPSSPFNTDHAGHEDISHIVDQVLSCIDANQFDQSAVSDMFQNETCRDGSETLCHNCALMNRNKTETCRQCGADMTSMVAADENLTAADKRSEISR
jgi:hypothetical protein